MSFQGRQILHETNWLGVDLVFYNAKNKKWNSNLNEVIDKDELRFSEEGLTNYLENGFVMYGLTPLEDVFYTLPNTTLIFDEQGNFELIRNPDPLLPLLSRSPSTSLELVTLLEEWFDEFDEEIVKAGTNVILPLSGGLDSRMLSSFVRDKSYVQAFTYGISMNQKRSYEVGLAKRAAKRMNLKWRQIELSSFHEHLERNYDIYSVSTHAHSMYHFEFFKKIADMNSIDQNSVVLTGIYADVWAGSWEFPQQIECAADLSSLVRHHGINLSGVGSSATRTKEVDFFTDHRDFLIDEKYRILTAARIKAPLIRHLIETPRDFGFNVVSPFFKPEIVACMLNLPVEDRKNRKWQHKFIERRFGKPRSYLYNLGNSSDLMGTRKIKLPSLDLSLLPKDFPNRVYLQEEKSRGLSVGVLDLIFARLAESRYLQRVFPKIGKMKSDFTAQYSDYMTLYPIIKLIRMSGQALDK
jgi:asparagine synthetase B (glutamine-hydrolysing)